MAVIPPKPGCLLVLARWYLSTCKILFAEVTPEAEVQLSALSKAAGPLAGTQEQRQDTPAMRFLIRLALPVSTSSGGGERAIRAEVREETMKTEQDTWEQSC